MSKINPRIESGWKEILEAEFQADYFNKLKDFLLKEREKYTVYPPGNKMFAAFDFTPFDKVKAVIIGQDPYHNPSQAHGLCFSVPQGVDIPPSLRNIYKELMADVGILKPKHGNLEAWARQGVLLLNATLSVRAHQAGSHQRRGWEQFTDAAIKTVSDQKEHIVFFLWGNYAKNKAALIDSSKHLILTSVHPSPLSASRGFFGCKHFSSANQYLMKHHLEPINWSIT